MAVGVAVPGLMVFALTFTGLTGAMAVLAAARMHRLRPASPVRAAAPVSALWWAIGTVRLTTAAGGVRQARKVLSM